MRTLTRIGLLFCAAFIVLFSAGCGDDTPGLPGGGVTLNPEVTLNSGAGLVSFNQEVSLSNPTITVSVSGQDGDAPLRDLAILEDGSLIPANQLNFRSGQTANNPILTTGADADGFIYEIEITPSNTTTGDVTFTFRLTDTDGEIGTTQVTVTYVASPPTVDLLVEDGFVSGDVTLTDRNPAFAVRLNYDDTEAPVASITVLEDGNVIPAEQLNYNNGAFTPANPLTLLEGESTGGTFDIGVTPDIDESGTRTYTFRVTDQNGLSNEVSVNVTFDIPEGTATTFSMEGVFFNASGGMNGGLDLDTGDNVPFNSASAEIQDEGINLNETPGTENWRTQISSVNDAVLRVADLSELGEGVTFADINVVEDIEQLYDTGDDPDGNDNFPDADGDTSASEAVTQPLREGDVLAVRRGDRTYLVRIDAINFVAGSNNDSYTVSIKY